MPELPEVENVGRSVRPHVLGVRVIGVHVRRRDIVDGEVGEEAMLVGKRVAAVLRYGKQLALVGGEGGGERGGEQDWPVGRWVRKPGLIPEALGGRVIGVQLGMTGSLRWSAAGTKEETLASHTHVVWRLEDGSLLSFRDPRRFGGLTTSASLREHCSRKWVDLGPDALTVTGGALVKALATTQRPIKSALLDQAVAAGIGNIYADEALFAAGIHPLTPANAVRAEAVEVLARHVRRILKRSVVKGGSTIRDYANGNGEMGGFQGQHQVYGRAGEKCRTCRTVLSGLVLQGRSTVYCGLCQSAEG
jgi:formamidopyrimidine-DNA glycosylase